ncbi:Nn.00g019880.m01.CDS01 [Neocucurbitaria sp. VM-36]
MQLYFLAIFTFLVSSVVADGVRNGYERVWLWYAYQIDLELPEDERKIAVRCHRWDDSTNTCPPTYPEMRRGRPTGKDLPNLEPCRGTRPNGACYFWELMGWIDGKRYNWNNNFLLPTSSTDPVAIRQDRSLSATVKAEQQVLNPDITRAAQWLAVAHPPDTTQNPIRAEQYRPWRAFKGATDVYNDMLLALGQHSTTTITKFDPVKKAANQGNIDAIKNSLSAVLIERAIDHSVWVRQAAQREGITLSTYREAGFTGDIVDWDASRALQTDTGRFDTWKTNYYNEDEARKHLSVMNDFRSIENMYNSPACSGP